MEEIIVFGSFTKGTWAPGSDVDLFIFPRGVKESLTTRPGRTATRRRILTLNGLTVTEVPNHSVPSSSTTTSKALVRSR